jgi:hypothetical protein
MKEKMQKKNYQNLPNKFHCINNIPVVAIWVQMANQNCIPNESNIQIGSVIIVSLFWLFDFFF